MSTSGMQCVSLFSNTFDQAGGLRVLPTRLRFPFILYCCLETNLSLAFDRPWSTHAWQYYVQHYINSKYPFVMIYLTTFVICATDSKDAEEKTRILLEETEDRGWRIVLPSVRDWSTSAKDLRLDKLFGGIGPI